MKNILWILLFALCTSCISVKADITTDANVQTSDNDLAEAAIRLVMQKQETAWNKHDLEGFMEGYWKSEALKFYGPSGLTLGWDNTLARYKKAYPTQAESGILNFVIKDISTIGLWESIT